MNEKKSWREIDKSRDRGFPGKSGRQKSALEVALEDPLKRKFYLQEAEKLFMGKKGDSKHDKDLKSLHEAYGAPDFDKKVKKYVEKYGMPEEWGDLMLLLDVKDATEIVINSLHAIKELLPKKGVMEKKGLKGKLKVIEMTHPESQVRDTVKEFLYYV
jgi:hypothetical protein